MDFYNIYEKYKHLMYTIAKDILGESVYAEDAMQNALISISKHINLINRQNENQAKSLIITITRNAAIDIRRKKEYLDVWEIAWEDIIKVPETYISSIYESSIIPAIQKIPTIYRDVLILKYVSNLETNEIASVLGISKMNVRKRLSRGKKLLEIYLKKEGVL